MRSKLLEAGFRPFFLGAAWLAVIWMGLWISTLLTGVPGHARIPALLWHGHEMLFGFAMAVLAGFLLTAMQNWTGLKRVTANRLAILAGLWFAARLAFVFADILPLWLVSLLDLAFLPLLCLVVGETLLRAGNRRNYSFIGLLLVFWILNILLHLQFHQPAGNLGQPALDMTVLLVTTLLVFMGGRVIPFFTGRRLPEAEPNQWPWLNWSSTLTTLALLPAYLLIGRDSLLIPLLIIAMLLAGARLLAWHPWRTAGEPMLWILHLGYAWLPLGLGLLALSLLATGLPWSVGLHALMVGGLGSLSLGMMARVALGHSGRPIQAPRFLPIGFVLLNLAALARVTAGLFPASDWLLMAAGGLWSLAFLIYAVIYTPILSKG